MSNLAKHFKLTSPLAFVFIILPVFAIAAADRENSAINDAWLEGKLATVITLNRHLNPFKIESDVVNGKATLIGRVDSVVEKNLLGDLARNIDGINEVANNVEVVTPPADAEPGALERLGDAAITTAIATKLLFNLELDSTKIDVDTNEKVVTLNGTVENDAEILMVEEIARNTFDVVSVNNQLIVGQ